MILDYFRPKTIEETLSLLKKYHNAIPIGGGSTINSIKRDVVVVDLQDLELKYIKKQGSRVVIGAMESLDQIGDHFASNEALSRALKIDNSKNQRIQSTLGGAIMAADGRSALLTCLLALDCVLFGEPGKEEIPLDKFLILRKENKKLITQISFDDPVNLRFESVSRSPLDKPIICCAINKKEKGGNNVSLAGFGDYPKFIQVESIKIMDPDKLVESFDIIGDQWATAKYRTTVASSLIKRLANKN